MKVSGKIYFFTKEFVTKENKKIFFLSGMLHNPNDKSTSWYDINLVPQQLSKKDELYKKLKDGKVYTLNIKDGFLSSKFVVIKEKNIVRNVMVVKDWSDKIIEASQAELDLLDEYKKHSQKMLGIIKDEDDE